VYFSSWCKVTRTAWGHAKAPGLLVQRPSEAHMTQESNRWLRTRAVSGDTYDATYARRAAAGEHVHGEADFIESLGPASVLDAGCGTGRVGRELARRGVDVVGVDLDPDMLATARRAAPAVEWHLADLARVDLARAFDAIVLAGNVMIFLTPGSERAVVENLARHLREEGLLVAGFQLVPGRLSLQHYDECAANAGFALMERWSTWERDAYTDGGNYAVSVLQKIASIRA
jgi:SAM-dependent methyltransferase